METKALKKIHDAENGPCKDCDKFEPRPRLKEHHEIIYGDYDIGHCSRIDGIVREIDGCSDLPIAEFLELKKEHGKELKALGILIKSGVKQRSEILRKHGLIDRGRYDG